MAGLLDFDRLKKRNCHDGLAAFFQGKARKKVPMQSHAKLLTNCLAAAALMLAARPANAATPAKPVVLNQQAIHIAYNEGDFDKVTKEIETFTNANKTYSHNDSIFVAKHLAVVYSANPNTREKGKYFMYRLLEMMPSAELVDMFVSDEIDRIFEKVRKEYLARQNGFGVDTTKLVLGSQAPKGQAAQPAPAASTATAATAQTPAPAQPGHTEDYQTAASAQQPLWKNKVFWIAGGAGLVVAGGLIAYISMSDETSSPKTITIGDNSQP
jgi:hypothetical protein